jgi:uncharacterized repeat protein (TIGR01451 family)
VLARDAVQRESLTNFDHRATARLAAPVGPAVQPGQQTARAELKRRAPDVVVDFDPVFGSPKWVRSRVGALTSAGGAGRAVAAATAKRFEKDPEQPVKAFLEEHRALFRHGPEVLAGARQHRNHTNEYGLRTVAWEQMVDGIPVFDSVFVAHSGPQGELVSLSSQFVPEPERAADRGTINRKAKALAPPISAEGALRIAAENLGEIVSVAKALAAAPAARTLKQHFQLQPLPGESSASLVWLPLDGDTLRLCWEVELNRREFSERFRLIIDAETGAVLVRRKLTVEVSEVHYRVYTSDSPAPMSPGLATPSNTQAPYVPRQLLAISNLNATASPLGWLADGVMETRGNNVDAHLDRDGDDRADLPRVQATLNGQGQRVFDFPVDLTTSPTNYQAAAVVQLFYWCNFMHDRLYELGFTESLGNFQKDNFGRGGADNDAVFADAQDGSGFNNANYTPTRDGSSPKIQMYIFNGPTPARDGDFDADIVLHEYTHGLTDRLIGGGVGISQLQTYGMGEGWSDFYALSLLAQHEDNLGGNYPMGGYATYQFNSLQQNYYYGIRRYPYSTNMNVNPLTFKDIDVSTASSHPGIPVSPIITSSGNAVHRQGEIWCSMLWDMRAALLRKYAPTNAADYTNVNRRILGYVTRGLVLAPPNPSFLQARDALLLAIQSTAGFASDTNQAWAAFARRGLGVGAICPDSSITTGVVESYVTPQLPEFSVQVSDSSFSGPVGGPFTPESQEHILSHGGIGEGVIWAAAVNVNWIQLSATQGSLSAGQTATNLVTLTAVAGTLPPGTYLGNIFYTNVTRAQVITIGLTLQIDALQEGPLVLSPTTVFLAQGQVGGPFNPPTREYQLANNGLASLGWHASTLNNWLTVTPTNGAIASGDFMSLDVTINSNAKALVDGTYFGVVSVVNTNTGQSIAISVSLRIGVVDYFMEEFVTGPFDLNYSTLTLTPDLSANFYRSCHESASMFPHNPSSGTILTLGDDEYEQIVLTNGRQVSIFGLSSNAIFIGANGNVTFDPGPNTNGFQAGLGFGEFFSRPRIAPLYADLNPAAGGSVSWQQLSDRLVVTWLEVPEFGVPANLNSAQLEMWFDGALRMTWLNAQINDPFNSLLYSGLSRGTGTPADFVKSDLSAYGPCVAGATVLLPSGANEGEVAVLGTVLLSAPLTNDLLVTFTSSDTNEIVILDPLLIPAGQTIGQFGFDAVDDGVADGSHRITITAHFPDRPSASAATLVHDTQFASLTINAVSSGTEGGVLSPAGTVTASVAAVKPIAVNLFSHNTNRARVAPFVIIPPGQTSVSFDLVLVDNDLFDGTADVVIEAFVFNWAGDFDAIRVSDNENRLLTVTLPPEVTEGQGMITNAGTVTFAGKPVTNVVVALQSDRPELLMVPAFVTNISGQTSVKFNLVAGDNGVTNAFDTVRIRASAPGFLSATGSVLLIDDERPFAPTEPEPVDQATHVARNTTLSWIINPNAPPGTIYDVFLGTNADLSLSSPVGTTSGSSITLPRHLEPDTTYYWQVLARLSPFPSEQSPVWQFHTVDFNFLINTIPSPQYVGEPFPLSIEAVDEFGLVVSNYHGTVTLTNFASLPGDSTLVISEMDVNGFDRVEFQNVSGRALNISGWKIVIYDWQTWPLPFTVFTLPTGAVSGPGEVFQLRSLPSQLPASFFPGNYPTFNMPVLSGWNNNPENNPIAVLVLDALGRAVDFVCAAGADPTLITIPAAIGTDQWSGLPVFANVDSTLSYQRVGRSDANAVFDWTFAPRSIGTNNVGLSPSFSNVVAVPFISTPLSFVSGVSTASVTMLVAAGHVAFGAADGRGRGVVGNVFDVFSRNDLALSGVVTNDILVNAPLVYHFTVTNHGPDAAKQVQLVDTLDTNSVFISAVPSQGGCVFSNGVVICALGDLSAGAEAEVTVLAAAAERGLITNFAAIFRAEPDGDSSNNSVALTTIATHPQVSILDITNVEPNSATQFVTLTLRLSTPGLLTGSVFFATSVGTATTGVDYQPTNGLVTFPPGVTNQTISVLLFPDTLSESNETFSVNLSGATNLELNRVTATATITDNDPIPSLSINDVTVNEGDAGSTLAVFNVRLSAPSGRIVNVTYATANSTALGGLDFVESYGQLVFPPGTTNLSVQVPVLGDLLPEPAKAFFVNLIAPGNAILARGLGVGTILDNDVAVLAGFTFAPIPGSNYSGAPVPVAITALDGNGAVATGFNGPATLLALREQHLVTVASNTTTWNLPLATSFHDARLQSIYLTNELGAAGRITALALDVAQLPGQILSNFTIRLRATPDSSYLGPAWQSNWTTNYQHDTLIPQTGWATFAFSTPFEYSGQQNLMVDFSFDNSSYSVDGLVRSTATTANRSVFLRTDSAHGQPLDWAGNTPPPTAVARVPNVRFVMDRTAPLIPTTTGNFINGVWNGTVTLHTITTNVFLRVVDAEGHTGSSAPFALVSLPALAIQREDGAVSLRFPSLPGISYVVEASATPVGAWSAVSGILIGDGGVLEFTHTPATQQFYRVHVDP